MALAGRVRFLLCLSLGKHRGHWIGTWGSDNTVGNCHVHACVEARANDTLSAMLICAVYPCLLIRDEGARLWVRTVALRGSITCGNSCVAESFTNCKENRLKLACGACLGTNILEAGRASESKQITTMWPNVRPNGHRWGGFGSRSGRQLPMSSKDWNQNGHGI